MKSSEKKRKGDRRKYTKRRREREKRRKTELNTERKNKMFRCLSNLCRRKRWTTPDCECVVRYRMHVSGFCSSHEKRKYITVYKFNTTEGNCTINVNEMYTSVGASCLEKKIFYFMKRIHGRSDFISLSKAKQCKRTSWSEFCFLNLCMRSLHGFFFIRVFKENNGRKNFAACHPHTHIQMHIILIKVAALSFSFNSSFCIAINHEIYVLFIERIKKTTTKWGGLKMKSPHYYRLKWK